MKPWQEKTLYRRYNEFRSHGLTHGKSVYLLQLMYELTPRGFEEYVRRYFYRTNHIKATVIGGYNDKGIDIIGSFKNHPLLVQCKKRATLHIKKEQILGFWHSVTHREGYDKNNRNVLVTTNRFSQEAKQVAKEYNISIRDYHHLLKRATHYSFHQFEQETGRNMYEKQLYKVKYFTEDHIAPLIETYVSARPKQINLSGVI